MLWLLCHLKHIFNYKVEVISWFTFYLTYVFFVLSFHFSILSCLLPSSSFSLFLSFSSSISISFRKLKYAFTISNGVLFPAHKNQLLANATNQVLTYCLVDWP